MTHAFSDLSSLAVNDVLRLNRFYEERVALAEYAATSGKFKMPGDAPMRAIRDLCGVLTPLQEATQLLQGDGGRSPLSVYLPVMHECLRALDPKRPVFVDSGDGDNLAEVSHADLHPFVRPKQSNYAFPH